jgi:CBS domain-containing protein
MHPTVAEHMVPCSTIIQASSNVSEAALRMLNEHTRELIVVDEDGYLLGMLRADDLFAVRGPTIRSTFKRARVVISKDTSALEAMRALHRSGENEAVVVDGDRVIGVFKWQESMEHSVM